MPRASPIMTSTSTDKPRRDPACVACSKAKRRCSRQLPTCRRCRVQGLRCAYPFTEARVMLPHSPQSSTHSASVTQPTSDLSVRENNGPAPHADILPLGYVPDLGQNIRHVTAPWFLESSSWDVDHIHVGDDDRITYPDSGLDYFIDRMKTWLDQWTSENHCAFVHPRLYGADLPNSLQHAFAAWRVYRAATNQTSLRIALRMSADWAQNLIQEVSMSDSLLGVGEMPVLLDQLGRTQAMLIFQVIGLFDGDVRARARSEILLSTVTRWADALLRAAGVAVASDQPCTPGGLLNSLQINQLRSDGTVASAWKAWLLSESIRRLWIVSTLTEAAFLIWQQGSALCPGSIGFTGRSGLWGATTPQSWLGHLRKSSTTMDPVFCRGLDQLLNKAIPSDVDDFTRALIIYGRGREAVEDWVASTEC